VQLYYNVIIRIYLTSIPDPGLTQPYHHHRHQWSEKWLLSLNSNKCHVVSYGRTNDTYTVYTIMDKNQQAVPLVKLDKIKDTGVYFNAK